MKLRFPDRVVCLALLIAAASQSAAEGLETADPSQVDEDYAIQGEYTGTLNDDTKLGVQVIALGEGKFRAVVHFGGLPGDGWDQGERLQIDGKRIDGKLTFPGDEATGVLENGLITVRSDDGEEMGKLTRVLRVSPTIGKKPPAGAVVLFDGSSVDAWRSAGGNGKAQMSDGLLHQGANSVPRFGSCQLHIEFRLPYAPAARGQARGNSGLYLQGRYEVQMLDSFGLEGKHNECGGIYEIHDPAINMCYPPLQWQTYDVEFTAATFDESGKKTAPARMTVLHNGVTIHDDVEVPRTTRAAPLGEGPEPGFMHLQNHGNPVRYRNVWVVEQE
jgi:hypothetical protein